MKEEGFSLPPHAYQCTIYIACVSVH